MYWIWELKVCLIRKDILLDFKAKNYTKQSKSIQSMTKNSMLWFKICVNSVIIFFQKSLFYILIMKLSSMPTLKRILTIIMGN